LRGKVTEKIELGAGFAFILGGNTQDPEVNTGFIFYRLQQDATVKQALGKVNFIDTC
jgi:hypothetical protein